MNTPAKPRNKVCALRKPAMSPRSRLPNPLTARSCGFESRPGQTAKSLYFTRVLKFLTILRQKTKVNTGEPK